MPQSSAARPPLLLCCVTVALLLLTAVAALNVPEFDIRGDSFLRALNHGRHLQRPIQGLRGARKTLIFNKDFLFNGGKFERHLIEGDYPGTGEANSNDEKLERHLIEGDYPGTGEANSNEGLGTPLVDPPLPS